MSLLVKAGGGAGGIAYTGDNPLTIGQNGYTFEPKTLLKNGLTIVNGVNGEDLTDVEARQALAVEDLMKMVSRKVSEARNFGDYVWKKWEALSDGYIPLEYIESTGTQYIDTGVSVPHASARVVVDFAPTVVSGDNMPITGHANTTFGWDTNFLFISGNTGHLTLNGVDTQFAVTADTRYVVDYTNSAYSINHGALVSASQSFTDGYNDTIFYSSGAYGKLKLYAYRIYDGDVLIRHFVPRKEPSGKIGLYDLVNDVFYNNAGTGEFIAGPVVKGTFVDYVVADDESAYPDGALHTDGYWYEKGEGGEHVWAKYKKYTVSFTQEGTTGVYKCSCGDIDLSTVDDEWFIGTSGVITTSSNTPYEFKENNVFKGTSSGLTWSYDPTTQKMTISYGSAGTRTMSDGVNKIFIDYVVSDDETAFPDGGEQDGYWYERVVEGLTPEMFGCTKIAIDNFTYSANTTAHQTALTHSLGECPSMAILFAKTLPTLANSIVRLMCILNQANGAGLSTYMYKTSSEYILQSGSTNGATGTQTTFSPYLAATNRVYQAGVEYTLITMV